MNATINLWWFWEYVPVPEGRPHALPTIFWANVYPKHGDDSEDDDDNSEGNDDDDNDDSKDDDVFEWRKWLSLIMIKFFFDDDDSDNDEDARVEWCWW